MNNIINQYLITNYIKIILNTILIFLALGIILNLFEEIEFFKNLNQSPTLPFILSMSFVPTLILDLLPFVIFLSSMFYFLSLKSNKDLLSIKIFGYSNFKITLIVASFAFLFGCFILIAVNPVTSTLLKYYEIEKAKYARDIDHLISVNKNGLWIKENDETGYKIISADKFNYETLNDVSIYLFNNNNEITKRIYAESALIINNPWQLKKVHVFDFEKNNSFFLEKYELKSERIAEKIGSLYKNLNTISFFDLVVNYSQLNKKGYTKKFLNKKINKFASLPVLLFLMVVLAAIFTIGSLKHKQSFYYIIVSILVCVIIYYFKDLSIALGETGKINLILSVWMPVIAISLFCSIGVIQINEK